jgi:hypothetical protein
MVKFGRRAGRRDSRERRLLATRYLESIYTGNNNKTSRLAITVPATQYYS